MKIEMGIVPLIAFTLTFLFTALKLGGVLLWSWFWVFSPIMFWLFLVVVLSFILFVWAIW